MKTSNSKHKAFALTTTRAAALITAALIATAVLFTACPNNSGGGGNSSIGNIEGVWKGLSMTGTVSGVTETHTMPMPHEDSDDPSNTNAKMQVYLCFYEGKMYPAVKYIGMTDSGKNKLFLQAQGMPYSLSGNALIVGGNMGIVNFPSAGRLGFTAFDSGDTYTYLCEKTSDYTAEQIKAAPLEP